MHGKRGSKEDAAKLGVYVWDWGRKSKLELPFLHRGGEMTKKNANGGCHLIGVPNPPGENDQRDPYNDTVETKRQEISG